MAYKYHLAGEFPSELEMLVRKVHPFQEELPPHPRSPGTTAAMLCSDLEGRRKIRLMRK